MFSSDFGAVHGEISVAYQYFRNDRIVGIEGDADAGAGRDLVIIQTDRLEERGFEPREKVVEIGMASRTLNGGELIPAAPRDELALEQQAGHASRQNLKHFVARAVSAKVVDLLEPIEIDGDQSDFAPSLAGESDLTREIVVEAGPIG